MMPTRVKPMIATLAALIALFTTACGDKASDVSTSPTTAAVATTTAEAPTTTAAPKPETEPGTTVMVTPFFIREGQVFAGQQRAVQGPAVATAAMTALIAGTNELETQQGLATGIAKNVVVNSLSVEDGVATIDLNRPFETANTRPQVAQVVFTLTQFSSIHSVKFLIDGETNGATGVMAIGRADLEDLTPAIFVDSPTPGATVASRFTIAGTANTFEANVPWAVFGPDGSVITQGTATATSGSGTRGTFDATIDLGDFQGSASLTTWVNNMETGAQDQLARIPIVVSG